jgi:hypothetical protein
MTNLFLIYYLIDKVSVVFIVASAFGGAYLFFAWLTLLLISDEHDDKWCEDYKKKYLKKAMAIAYSFILVITIMLPSKRDVLICAGMIGIDKGIEKTGESLSNYNKNNPQSSLNMDGILKIMDGVISKADDYLKKD